MYVEFQNLYWKNIKSYGSKVTKFDIHPGLNLLSGLNGAGKTTFLDAICFCIFGEPFSKKVKLQSIINRYNKKDLVVGCNFKIGNSSYLIERGLKPVKIKIEKDGKELELLSTKKLNQEEINRVIGIDVTLFRQRVGLSVVNNKPFLSLTTPEKREVLESIFNIKVFSLMANEVRKKLTVIKTDRDINQKALTLLESNLKSMLSNKKEVEKSINNFEKDKELEIEGKKKDIDEKNEEIKSLKEKVSQFKAKKKKLGKVDESMIHTKREKESSMYQLKSELSYIDKNISNLSSSGDCPFCGQKIDEDHKKKETEKFLKQKEEKNILLTQIQKNLEEIGLEEKKKEAISELDKKVKDITSRIPFFESRIRDIQSDIEKIHSRVFDFDMDKFQTEIDEKSSEYKDTYKQSKQLNKEFSDYKIIHDMLKDDGIKTFFFNKLVPILNDKVNYYLDIFEMPIIVKFDSTMEERITDFNRRTIDYYDFSEGEKKRIEFSIMLSFIDLTKVVFGWDCNLLFFDEVFDSSVDTNGITKLVGCLRRLHQTNNKLSSFIISHRSDLSECSFSHRYIIQKKEGFSELDVT